MRHDEVIPSWAVMRYRLNKARERWSWCRDQAWSAFDVRKFKVCGVV